MMTFKHFLNEDAPQTLESFLAKKCIPLLHELNTRASHASDLPLYRGTNSSGEPITLDVDGVSTKCHINVPRRDRQPMNMPADVSKLLDDLFEDRFGWRPRSQGIFMYGKSGLRNAKAYGAPHKIFPIGPLKFVWSPRISDLYGNLDLTRITLSSGGNDLNKIKAYLEKDIIPKYQDTGLDDAVNSRAEIVVSCGSYLAVPA